MVDCSKQMVARRVPGLVKPPPYPGYFSISRNFSLSACGSPIKRQSLDLSDVSKESLYASTPGSLMSASCYSSLNSPDVTSRSSHVASSQPINGYHYSMNGGFTTPPAKPERATIGSGHWHKMRNSTSCFDTPSASLASPEPTSSPDLRSPGVAEALALSPAVTHQTRYRQARPYSAYVTSTPISSSWGSSCEGQMSTQSPATPSTATASNHKARTMFLTNGYNSPKKEPISVAPKLEPVIETLIPVVKIQAETPKIEEVPCSIGGPSSSTSAETPQQSSSSNNSSNYSLTKTESKSSSGYGSCSSASDLEDTSSGELHLSMQHRDSTSSGYVTNDASPTSQASPNHSSSGTGSTAASPANGIDDEVSFSPSPIRKLYLSESFRVAGGEARPAVAIRPTADVLSLSRKFSAAMAKQEQQQRNHRRDASDFATLPRNKQSIGKISSCSGLSNGHSVANGVSPAYATHKTSLQCNSSADSAMAQLGRHMSRSTSVPAEVRTTKTIRLTGGKIGDRSPKEIKEALLKWCQLVTRDYRVRAKALAVPVDYNGKTHVSVTNFSSSWADGMAFCAIVHHFIPNAFDFDKLDPKDRRTNFDLAFNVAEERGHVVPLLETDDMLMMGDRPDWKCVYTYVQSIYKRFGGSTNSNVNVR